jgi:hypothetical protein
MEGIYIIFQAIMIMIEELNTIITVEYGTVECGLKNSKSVRL